MNKSNQEIARDMGIVAEGLCTQGNHASAMIVYIGCATIDPENGDWDTMIGSCAAKLGRLDDAELAYTTAADRFCEQGNSGRAREALLALTALQGLNDTALFFALDRLGIIEECLGLRREAMATYRRAIDAAYRAGATSADAKESINLTASKTAGRLAALDIFR